MASCNLSLEWLEDRALPSVIVPFAHRFTTNAQDIVSISCTVRTATVIKGPVVLDTSVTIRP